MKVTKKYNQLVSMYKYNPIKDCSLFENMETQYLYSPNSKKKAGMHQYVYWYAVGYEEFKMKKQNETFKSVELSRVLCELEEIEDEDYYYERRHPLENEEGKCIIPEGVTVIGTYSLSFLSSLESVQFPSTLTTIGDMAFYKSGIVSINIPEGVTSIGFGCFFKCEYLRKVKLPSTLKYIGDNAFLRTELEKIIIPKDCIIETNTFEEECEVIRK